MIYTILAISGASLGFRCITGKGMILYFLRGWLDRVIENKELLIEYNLEYMNLIEGFKLDKAKAIKENIPHNQLDCDIKLYQMYIDEAKPYRYDWLIYCMKPIILCCTCMSSVHTLIWYHYLTGVNPFTTWDTVLVCLIVAFLNTILFATYELISSLKDK